MSGKNFKKLKEKNDRSANIDEYSRVQEIIAEKQRQVQMKMKRTKKCKETEERKSPKIESSKQIAQQIEEERKMFKTRIKEATRTRFDSYCKNRDAQRADEKRKIAYLRALSRIEQETEIEF